MLEELRITFTTPAAKPSIMKTIKPHGDVPAAESRPQPSAMPTRTPATNSLPIFSALAKPPAPELRRS